MLVSPRLTSIALVLGLAAVSCTSSVATTTTTTTHAGSTTTSTVEVTSTTAGTTTTTIETTTTTALAGDPIDLFASRGDVLAVVGVAHDDVLNVREGPGTASAIVTTLDPLGSAEATGQARNLPQSLWYEVTADAVTGWVSVSFVAFAGITDDATAEGVSIIRGATFDSMEELGLIVAESQASPEDPVSRVVMSAAPIGFGLVAVVYDVVGLGDDSVYGYRLRIVGEEGPDGFSLHSVERTALCGRGVDPDGLCV
jgi:hypothetical protein